MSCFAPRALATTSASRASCYPLQARSVLHYPRKWTPKKFKPQPHPSSFAQKLESGAVFTYNPPSSAPDYNSAFPSVPASESPAAQAAASPSVGSEDHSASSSSSTSPSTPVAMDTDAINARIASYQSASFNPLVPIVSPTTGRALPLAWKKVPGYGHLAPRIDRLPEGTIKLKGARRELLDEEVLGKIERLRKAGKSKRSIASTLHLDPNSFSIAESESSRGSRAQREFEHDLRLERQSVSQAHARDSRVLRKAWW